MTLTPLRMMMEDPQQLNARLDAAWRALGPLDCREPEAILQVRTYFREHVREPILFQESRVLPALLELEPEAAPVIREARLEHAEILASCGRLFMELALCFGSRQEGEHRCSAGERGRAILDEVLARMARRGQRLQPLLRSHEGSITARLALSQAVSA